MGLIETRKTKKTEISLDSSTKLFSEDCLAWFFYHRSSEYNEIGQITMNTISNLILKQRHTMTTLKFI